MYALQLEMRPDFPEATRVVHYGPCHNSKGTPSFPLLLEKNRKIPLSTSHGPSAPAVTLEESHILLHN